MAIPGFQDIMLPLLQYANDGQEHTWGETYEALANYFDLTQAERQELLPSGKQSKFQNRVGWAITYLFKTKILIRTGRGRYCITERGYDVLNGNPQKINLNYLEQFPELAEFRSKSRESKVSESEKQADSQETFQTPAEVLEENYQILRSQLETELLEQVMSCSPAFFENLVIDLLVAMGYGGSRRDAGKAVGRSGDGGIDGIINEDKLGLDVVYVQAKRWQNTVGRPVVQEFAGSLEGRRAKKGILITTSDFSKQAHEYISVIEKKIVLIGGAHLARLMIDYDIGVTLAQSYTIKRIDADYFTEG